MKTPRDMVLPGIVVAGVLALSPARAWVQEANPADRFQVTDVMVPMRDGVKLHTKIFVPKDQASLCPSS